MRSTPFVPLLAALLLTGCASAPGEPAHLAPTQIPVPSMEDRAAAAGWLEGGDWLAQHEDIRRAVASRHPRVVFIGDSITQSWGGDGRRVSDPGRAAWNREFSRLSAVNAGISGDRTQHVLWRIDHGLFEGFAPDVVVLMIGTNNLPDDSAIDIADGVKAIVTRLHGLHPEPAILLLGIPPRGRSQSDELRDKGRVCNDLLAELARRERADFLDPTPFLTRGGADADPARMASDFIHLTPSGYDALAAEIAPRLRVLLRADRPRRP
jgi:beta-glucosidase